MTDETNPYLALLQQERPRGNWLDILSNALLGAGSGLSQAGASGQSGWAGIGSGLMLGNQMTAQAERQAEQERIRRLQIGIQASEWDEKRKLREQDAAARDAYVKGGGVPGINVQPSPYQMGPGDPAASAIAGLESGGRYDAVGPVANKQGQRAYGKYQVMDFNIGPWTQEVLGRPMTPQEFLANPQAQDAVFNAKFGQYSQKYGPVGASRAWFAGEGGMNNPNASDVNGMTVQRYGDRFAQSRGVAQANTTDVNQVVQSPQPPGPPRAGASSPAGPPPMPQFATLPPFVGPGFDGMGIQPGATDTPTLMPPQIAQGGGGPTTASGAPVDPNAPMPAAVGGPLPTPGGPNAVQVQYKPTPETPSMAPTAPPPRLRQLPPELEARINGLVAMRAITIPQAEKMKQEAQAAQYQGDLKAWEVGQQISTEQRKIDAQKAAEQRKLETELVPVRDSATKEVKWVTKAEALAGRNSGQIIPLEAGKEARAEAEAALAKAKDEREAAQAAVGPTGRPQQGPIDAKAAAAAAEAKARADVEMQNKPALQFAEKEVARFSETVQPGAEAAANGLTNLYEMKRLTEGNLATGTGIDGRMFTARLLDTLGIKDMPQGMVNTTEYLNRASKGVISVLQTGALGKTQISEGDRKFVEQMAAKDVGFTRQELQRLVDVAIDASHKTLDQHGKSVDRISRLIGDKVAKDYFKVDRQTYEEWKKDNPAAGSAPGATTQGGPGQTAGALPQPKSKADFDKLPTGTLFLDPNGQQRVKP